MPAARAPHGHNQPPKVIVKKVYVEGHGGHHGGAWKVAYADFVTHGGWKGAKEKGVVRSEGKEYVVQDGDVMLFRFNV